MLKPIEDGLFDWLAAGTALTAALGGTAIYDTVRPDNTDLPAIVYSYSGGGDENITQTQSIDVLYTVRAISDDQAEAATLAGLIRGRLHDAEPTFSGWECWNCQHTNAIKYSEIEDRRKIHHAGGIYRIRATETA